MYKEKLGEVTFGTFLGIIYNITKDTPSRIITQGMIANNLFPNKILLF